MVRKVVRNAIFCADIGAPKSVIEFKAPQQICRRKYISLTPSISSFCYGGDALTLLGTVMLYLQTPPEIPPIDVRCDVVIVNIPPLLGLDVLDRHNLKAGTVTNQLIKKTIIRDEKRNTSFVFDDWHVPLTRENQYAYVKMCVPGDFLYTLTQLKKIHRSFFNLSP